MVQLRGVRGPWRRLRCRDTDCLCTGVTALPEAPSKPLSWRPEASLASLAPAPPIQTLRGLPCLGPCSEDCRIRHSEGRLVGSHSAAQRVRHLVGRPLIVQPLMLACGETEATVTAPPPTVTQRCHLAPVAAWLSSTGVSHHDLLPHIPSTRRAAVSSIPHPGVAPHSPKSSSQPLRLPGDQPSCPGYVRLQQGLFNSHSIQSATDRLFHAQP